MAEATLRDLIKVMNADMKASASADENQKKATYAVRDEVQRLTTLFNKFFLAQKAAEGDKLEADREKRKVKDNQQRAMGSASSGAGGKVGGSLKELIQGMGGLTSLGTITAGLAATTAALAGVRGWEMKALSNIDELGKGLKSLIPISVVDSLKQGFVNQRASILRIFGFDPALKAFGGAGDDVTLKTPLLTQITNRFKTLRSDFMLKYFGIGVDGKATVKVTGPGKALLQIEDGFKNIIGPFRSLGKGIATFLEGTGKVFVDFLAPYMKGGAKLFGTLFKRILWPVGILMDLFAGVKAFQGEEGDFYDKTAAGISTSIGSFLGSPLDLLKGAIGWITKTIFGLETNEDGTVKEGQGLPGAFVKVLEGLDFKETITSIVKAPFTLLKGVFNFATSAEYRAEVIEDGKETIRGWGRQFVEWIGSILPSMEGLKQWFTETAQKYLPEAVYKRLFNVPEPMQSVDLGVLDLDGDGRLSGKEIRNSRDRNDPLNATRELLREKLMADATASVGAAGAGYAVDGMMQRGIAIPQNLRLQTGGDTGAGGAFIVQGGTDNSSSTAVLENGSIVVQDVGLDGQSN